MLFGIDDDDSGEGLDEDQRIVIEAADRWMACKDWQGVEDERSREDIKFANGDARNGWQWPTKIYQERTSPDRDLPCLTINNTRVHNDLIINAISKNAYGVKVRPAGGKASYKAAEIMETLVRRTEYISKASSQYRKVTEQQVDGGVGYILIETRRVSARTFAQEIYLKASQDPTAVYLDPWIREPDGSDARFGFIFERIPRKEFGRKYPDWKNKVGASPLSTGFVEWLSDKEIMVAKYFRRNERKDTLVGYTMEDGNEIEKLASDIKRESGEEIYKELLESIKNGEIDGQTAEVLDDEVEWFLIAGDKIIDRGKWAGRYIPICRCVGREMVIDATLDRKGHTRPLIDAQRMLNFNASTDVQVNALQPKSPWLAAARAVEGQEQWKTANVDNFAVLLYNDVDDEAPVEMQKIDAPQRIAPPQGNPGYQNGMQNAERQMMMISGQFQAQMGENDQQSAASGKAINERQQQGDTATYHFVEHQSDMKRFIGVQLIDLYPKIYDTERLLHITGEKGEKDWVLKIDPNMKDALQEIESEKEDMEAAKIAFNPAIGQYECISDPGPDFATQRQEAWNAYTIILQQNMQLAAIIGDQIFRYGDFPGADKIADRLEKEIKATKPYLFDEDATPQMVEVQQQLQRLTALNAELMQKLAMKELALKGKDEKRDIEAFNAETNRMKATIEALSKLLLTPAQREQMEHEIALKSHDAGLQIIVAANQAELQQQGTGNGNPS